MGMTPDVKTDVQLSKRTIFKRRRQMDVNLDAGRYIAGLHTGTGAKIVAHPEAINGRGNRWALVKA